MHCRSSYFLKDNLWKKIRHIRKAFCLLAITILLSITVVFAQGKQGFDTTSAASIKGTEVYKADIESTRKHYKFPAWFRDDKFGIFIYWGVYSVPAFGTEWYPKTLALTPASGMRMESGIAGIPNATGQASPFKVVIQ